MAYKIYRDGQLITTTNDKFFTDTGLTPGTLYSYHVDEVNDNGELINTSNNQDLVTLQEVSVPPANVVNLAFTFSTANKTVKLTWTPLPTSEKVAQYIIRKNGEDIGTSTNPLFESPLTYNVTNVYTVHAKGTNNKVNSGSPITVTVTRPPTTPPNDLVVSNITTTSFDVSW